jgi:hypothetical protein
MSSAPRFILLIVCFIRGIEYWSYHDGSHVSYHLDISGSDPVLRGATVLAHLQPGRRRVITQKTLLWQESWSRPAISSVRSLWPVRCKKPFPAQDLKTKPCTFPTRVKPIQYLVFSYFWLTTCPVFVVLILFLWQKVSWWL